jgi:hypothetical protein
MDADAIRELLDKQAIAEVVFRYCRGIDRCDEALMRSTYHPDALDEHGSFKGTGWEWCRYIVEQLPTRWEFTYHMVPNLLIRVVGDQAFSEGYVLAHQARTEDGERMLYTFGGRYADRFERRDGVWRISHRVAIHEWTRSEPLSGGWPFAATEYAQATRDDQDPSYRFDPVSFAATRG